jgi:hypothetical protein
VVLRGRVHARGACSREALGLGSTAVTDEPPSHGAGAPPDGEAAPSPSQPPAPPPPRITLEDHARISASIAERDRSMKEVLEAERIDESAWMDATSYWMKKMAEDAAQRGVEATLAIDYSDAFSRAQDAIRPVPEMTPEEWAGLAAEILIAGGPGRPLAARNLSQADYLRLARHWAKRLAGDPAQNRRYFVTFEAMVSPDRP